MLNLCSLFPPPQESVKLPPSGDCPPTREWVLVEVVKSSHLGSRKRLAKLEKTKIGPGMATIQPILFHLYGVYCSTGGTLDNRNQKCQ